MTFTATLLAAGYQVGTGRTVPTLALVVALTSVIFGVRAMRRRHRAGALVSLALAFAGVVIGGIHGLNAAGGLGTGNGLAGAVIAVVLGLAGLAVGGLALTRSTPATRP